MRTSNYRPRVTYYTKAIISGNTIEYSTYEKGVSSNNERKQKKARKKNRGNVKFISTQSYSRARLQIKRLVNSNTDLSKFITLTFAEHITDINIANDLFKKFIMRLKYEYGQEIKYLAVLEFTKIGRVHYHFVINLPYVKNSYLAEIWTHGFVKINKVYNKEALGSYVAKYLSKETCDLRFGRKKYFTSKNILKPIVYTGAEAGDFLIKNYKNLEHLSRHDIDSPYLGKVVWHWYKAKHPLDI